MANASFHLVVLALATLTVFSDLATPRSLKLNGLLRFAVPSNNDTQKEDNVATLPAVPKSKVRFHFSEDGDNVQHHHSAPKSAEQVHMEYLYRKLASRHMSPSPTSAHCYVTSYRSRALSIGSNSDPLCTSFHWLLPEDSDATTCYAQMWFAIDHFRDLITASPHSQLLTERPRLQIVAGSYQSAVAELDGTWASVADNKWVVVDATDEVRERASASEDAKICVRHETIESSSMNSLSVSAQSLNNHQHHRELTSLSPFSVSGVRKLGTAISLAEFIRDHNSKVAEPAHGPAAGRRRRSSEEGAASDTPTPGTTYPSGVEVIAESSDVPESERCQRHSLLIHLPDYLDDVEVLKPKNVDISDCYGSCEFGDPGSSHAFFMMLARQSEQNRDRPMSSSCCIPSQFESERFPLMIRTRNNTEPGYKVEYVSSPVVTACGCS